ncbi:MAG: hypothetical protein ACI38Q_00030 [Candidatus Bruticola sp.]
MAVNARSRQSTPQSIGGVCPDGISSWGAAERIAADVQTELTTYADKIKQVAEALNCCLEVPDLLSLSGLHETLIGAEREELLTHPPLISSRAASLRTWALKETENAFRKNFRAAAAESGWEVRCTGAEPLEFKVGPFYIRPNFAEGTCSVAYARVSAIDNLPLEASSVFTYLNSLTELLNSNGYKNGLIGGLKSDSPEGHELFCQEYFADVWTAYNTMLRCRRKSVGDRVPLHDIWAVLSVLRQNQEFRDSGDSRFFKEYSRLQFCWDIVRLRRCGGLQRGKLRLNLSTATIGTTKNKEKVFWLDDGVGNGQYYLSLWFQNKE